MAKINGIQLDMFDAYEPPHIKKWNYYIRGWRPKVGEIARVSGFYHLKGDDVTDKMKERHDSFLTGYIVAVNETHVEFIRPFLADTPWCEQMHIVAPLISIQPEVSSIHNDAEFRHRYPISII